MFSRRSLIQSPQNALFQRLEALRQVGREILDLTVSNPTEVDLPYDSEGILRALGAPRVLRYEPSAFGLSSAREAIAAAHPELSVDPARIVVTASTSESYSILFKLLCDPDDEVLVPEPSYPLFEHLARYENVRLVPYRMAYEAAWHIDFDSIERARTDKTRAILLVSPNNPTGAFVKKAELDRLASLGLPLVSDEVFARYPFSEDPRRAASALEAKAPLVFALGGLSKMVALPQIKVGWIFCGGDGRRIEEALSRLEFLCDAYLSASTPSQTAVGDLLKLGEPTRRAIQERTRKNLALLRGAIREERALSILDVEGGWYATLRVPRTTTEEQWVVELLDRHSVLVHPGHFFDFEAEAYVVVSLLTREDIFAEGAKRLMDHARAMLHTAG